MTKKAISFKVQLTNLVAVLQIQMPRRVELCAYIKAEHNQQRDQTKLINMARRNVTFSFILQNGGTHKVTS